MKARHKDTGEIIQLAEEGIISSDGRRFCWYQVELLPEPIDEFQPSLPSNLDEAAEKYADYNSRRWQEDGDIYYDHSKIVDAFKAGVKWIEEQGVDAKCVGSCNPISESPDIRLHSITLFYEEHKDTPYVIKGDKLKVILRRSNNLARPKREFTKSNYLNQKEEE